MGLSEYKEILGASAGITTIGQMLSGTLICKDIYKKGTSKDVDPMPFVGGTAMCLLMLRYALLLQESTMISINCYGFLINVFYVVWFYWYSPNKGRVLGLLNAAMIFVGLVVGYSIWEDEDKILFRYGIIVTACLLMLIASPLIHLGTVLKTKNSEILPFPLILTGTLVSFQWMLYGIIIDDAFTIFQNTVGFGLNTVQLALCIMYPAKSATSETTKSSSSKKAE